MYALMLEILLKRTAQLAVILISTSYWALPGKRGPPWCRYDLRVLGECVSSASVRRTDGHVTSIFFFIRGRQRHCCVFSGPEASALRGCIKHQALTCRVETACVPNLGCVLALTVKRHSPTAESSTMQGPTTGSRLVPMILPFACTLKC